MGKLKFDQSNIYKLVYTSRLQIMIFKSLLLGSLCLKFPGLKLISNISLFSFLSPDKGHINIYSIYMYCDTLQTFEPCNQSLYKMKWFAIRTNLFWCLASTIAKHLSSLYMGEKYRGLLGGVELNVVGSLLVSPT